MGENEDKKLVATPISQTTQTAEGGNNMVVPTDDEGSLLIYDENGEPKSSGAGFALHNIIVNKLRENRNKQLEKARGASGSGASLREEAAAKVDKDVDKQLEKEGDYVGSAIDMLLSRHKPLTIKEVQAMQKRQKRDALMAAIGDGINALSSLVGASRGGLNTFDYSRGLSEQNRKRWERLNKEREDSEAAYLKYALMKENRQKEAEALKYKMGRDKKQDELKERELELKEAKDQRYSQLHTLRLAKLELENDLMHQRITKAEYDTALANYRAQEKAIEVEYETKTGSKMRMMPHASSSGGSGKQPAGYTAEEKTEIYKLARENGVYTTTGTGAARNINVVAAELEAKGVPIPRGGGSNGNGNRNGQRGGGSNGKRGSGSSGNRGSGGDSSARAEANKKLENFF